VELASIAIKLLVDVLLQVGSSHSMEDIPTSVSQLLLECNRASDQSVEQEILDKFLVDTKRIIETQIHDLRAHQRRSHQQIVASESRSHVPAQPARSTSMQAPGELLSGDPGQNQNPAAGFLIKSEPGSLSSRNEELVVPEEGIQRELERLSGKLEEQKLKAKHLQLNLAGKIVILEEQLEQASIEHEERIQQLERAHQEEVRRLTAGVEQREAQLLQLCDDYREEARDLQFKLETSWKPAEESKTIQKMEKGTRGNLYKLMKDEYERLFRTN